MNKVIINIVKGSDGASLQVIDKEGCGFRVAGPKAWGNPYNKPTHTFEIDADELVRFIDSCKFESED